MEKINFSTSYNFTQNSSYIAQYDRNQDLNPQPVDEKSKNSLTYGVAEQEHTSNSNQQDKISLSRHSSKTKEQKLSPQEKIEVEKLKRIDAHVKAHELAHIMAGGPYIRGGAHYTYVIGPDGNRYAVAGEVKIDVSPVPGNPDQTIRKAETIRRAALAPSDPSPQDRAVAQKAAQMAMKARIEKLKKESEKIMEMEHKKDGQTNETDEQDKHININKPYIGIASLKQLIKQSSNTISTEAQSSFQTIV